MHRPSASRSAPPIRIPELSLVLPAYNEEAGVIEVVREYDAALAARCRDYEILVVDDGSSDRTPALLRSAAAELPRLRIETQPCNLGYAAALIRGFRSARFDPILYTDADGQFDLADLDRALPLLGEGIDLVAGYRAERADSRLRSFASLGFNLLARRLLAVRARDIDCAFKLFRRSFFERVTLSSSGFLIDAEIFARAARAGLGVAQLPVRHRHRRAGRSTVRPAAVWRTWIQLLALRSALRSDTGSLVHPAIATARGG